MILFGLFKEIKKGNKINIGNYMNAEKLENLLEIFS